MRQKPLALHVRGKLVRSVLGFVGALIESPSEGLATARGWSPYIDWWLDDRSPWKVFENDTHYAIIFFPSSIIWKS